MTKLKVQNTEITILTNNEQDYISLTDMARSQMQEHIIFRWLSLKSTLEYIGEWEMLYNPNFNEVVSKLWHNLFYAQSPDFRKPGLCYSPKFLYL